MKFGLIITAALFLAGCGLQDLKPFNQAAKEPGKVINEPAGAKLPSDADLPELPDFSEEYAQLPLPRQNEGEHNEAKEAKTQEQLTSFIETIQKSDPQHETILRVFLTEKQELAVVLNRQAERDLIPLLARTLLIQMNKVFPGEQLRIVFYSPTRPLFQIGKAELDIYRGLMTYTSNQSLL